MYYLPAILGSSLALAAPNCEAEFRLMAGLTSVVAASIELDGFACERVLRIEEGRFDDEGGRVLKVVCEGAGRTATYKVVAYTEGDFVTSPWDDEPVPRTFARTR